MTEIHTCRFCGEFDFETLLSLLRHEDECELQLVPNKQGALIHERTANAIYVTESSSEPTQPVQPSHKDSTMVIEGHSARCFTPKISRDQQAIVDALRDTDIVVQANPGSGKSTTALAVACMFPKTCILTYSARLKQETREKARERDVEVQVHSYHSYARSATGLPGFDDHMLQQAVSYKQPWRRRCHMDTLVLDEQQDQTPVYWQLVCRILAEFRPSHVLVLGDARQCIFDFKGADNRFLTHMPQILVDHNIRLMRLSESFRVTRSIADFVNTVLQCNTSPILSNRHGPPVTVCTCDIWNWGSFLHYLDDLIAEYGAGNTFILAPSVKRRKHIIGIQEHLVDLGTLMYAPIIEDTIGSEEATHDKVVFSTYHGCKGRERDLVVVLGFDDSYTKFYNRSGDPHVCSNTVYVASTRARKKLVMVRHWRNAFEPYVDVERMNATCDMRTFTMSTMYTPPGKKRRRVTDLVSHLSDDTSARLYPLLQECFTQRVTQLPLDVKIPTCAEQSNGKHEELSTITSLLINDEVEQAITKEKGFVGRKIAEFQTDAEVRKDTPNPRIVDRGLRKASNAPQLQSKVIHALAYNTIVEKESFRLAQIDTYDWITEEQLEDCARGACTNLDLNGAVFEQALLWTGSICGTNMEISGRVDIVTPSEVIENKATTAESLEHKLQVVLYSWLWRLKGKQAKTFVLYYQLSGNTFELHGTDEQVDEIARILLESDLNTRDHITDDTFVSNARHVYCAEQVAETLRLVVNACLESLKKQKYRHFLYHN